MQTVDPPVNAASQPTEALRTPEHLTIDEVRGGTTGNHVRYILMLSLAGALMALGAAWMWVI